MTLSQRLREVRAAKGMSQPNVSEATGISLRAYRYYESGHSEPTASVLISIAKAFDVSIDYLVGLSDKPHRE